MKHHGIHTLVIKGKRRAPVSTLEAVGFGEPEPYIRALFSATVNKTKEEMKTPNPTLPTEKMREKILRMSLFPNIYN
jgi:hypothetical protein